MKKEKNIFKLFKESLKNKQTWIPNLLTSSRLLGTFIIPPLFFSGNYLGTAIAIAFFSATDFFDGKVARKYNGTSEFGRLLDPIVDKIFAGGLALAVLPKFPLITINLIPEAIIAFINAKSFNGNGNPKSTLLGKLKTFFLFPTIGLCYLNCAFSNEILNVLTVLASFSTLAIQSLTAYDYHKKAKASNKNEPLESKEEKEEEKTLEKENTHEKDLSKTLTRAETIEMLKEMKEEYLNIPKEEKPKIKVKKKSD